MLNVVKRGRLDKFNGATILQTLKTGWREPRPSVFPGCFAFPGISDNQERVQRTAIGYTVVDQAIVRMLIRKTGSLSFQRQDPCREKATGTNRSTDGRGAKPVEQCQNHVDATDQNQRWHDAAGKPLDSGPGADRHRGK